MIVPIGKKVLLLRSENNISFEQMVQLTNIDSARLKTIESGKETPDLGQLLSIGSALGLSPEETIRIFHIQIIVQPELVNVFMSI